MTDIIKKYGLSHKEMATHLARKMGVERVEISGDGYRIANNDNVLELQDTELYPDNSVGLIVTSIPFATQYEYSPNYADFGHSESNEEFSGRWITSRQIFTECSSRAVWPLSM